MRETDRKVTGTVDLSSYSPIVQMIMQARIDYGNQTNYDYFLCEFSGDPWQKQRSKPLEYKGPGGKRYDYNNPHMHVTSFTHEGTLLDIRHARGQLRRGDETAEYLVASADMKSGTLTKWQVQSVTKYRHHDGMVTELALTEPRYDGSYPMERADLQRLQAAPILGRLTLHQNHGNVFMQPDLIRQDMHDLKDLVTTVNDLTTRLNIQLNR